MREEQFRKAFETVAPSDELVNKVLAFNGNTVPIISVQRKAHIRRIVCTAAAVCAVMICGLTAAAAAGIFDFKEVFGNFIGVIDSSRANSLAAAADTFTYKVSDGDYGIRIKGVTGTDTNIIAVAEIYRTDGEPVSEHFANPTEETHLTSLWDEHEMNGLRGVSWGYYINGAGNIEMHFDISGDRSLNGRRFTVRSENFYPTNGYWNFITENRAGYIHSGDFSSYVEVIDGKGSSDSPITDFDDSSVTALKLKWEFSFEYKASKDSLRTKSCKKPKEQFTLYQNNRTLDESYLIGMEEDEKTYTAEKPVTVNSIDIGTLGGNIEMSLELSDYEQTHFVYPLAYFEGEHFKNEIHLITEDVGVIPVRIGSSSGSNGNGMYKLSCELVYGSDPAIRKIVDIDSVTAVSINGTVYALRG